MKILIATIIISLSSQLQYQSDLDKTIKAEEVLVNGLPIIKSNKSKSKITNSITKQQ